MEIHNTSPINKFAEELKDLFDKHGIKSIKPLSMDAFMGYDEQGKFNVVYQNIQSKDSSPVKKFENK